MNFNPFFGFETEYGITIEGGDATDLIKASREVVKAYDLTGLPFRQSVELSQPKTRATINAAFTSKNFRLTPLTPSSTVPANAPIRLRKIAAITS